MQTLGGDKPDLAASDQNTSFDEQHANGGSVQERPSRGATEKKLQAPALLRVVLVQPADLYSDLRTVGTN